MKAIVFTRNCGATTGPNTEIAVIPAWGKLENDVGNVFIEDTDHDEKVTLDVDVTWKDKQTLQIKFDNRARVYRKQTWLFVWGQGVNAMYGNLDKSSED